LPAIGDLFIDSVNVSFGFFAIHFDIHRPALL
jgi:hypothetical protein